MKILHVVAYYPPDRMGGVGEVVAHLHRGLGLQARKAERQAQQQCSDYCDDSTSSFSRVQVL